MTSYHKIDIILPSLPRSTHLNQDIFQLQTPEQPKKRDKTTHNTITSRKQKQQTSQSVKSVRTQHNILSFDTDQCTQMRPSPPSVSLKYLRVGIEIIRVTAEQGI